MTLLLTCSAPIFAVDAEGGGVREDPVQGGVPETEADAETDTEGSDQEAGDFPEYSDETFLDDSDLQPGNELSGLPDDPEGGTGYIMSRFTGTFIGFGVGHYLQGRWLRTGWLYTLGNFLTFPVITWIWPLYGRGEHYRAGLAAWAAIHSLEIWDVWSHEASGPVNEGMSVRALSFREQNHRYYGLALSWNF